MSSRLLNTVSVLSFLSAILILISGLIGIYTPGFYKLETVNWQQQAIAQDIIDVFLIVPLSLGISILSYLKPGKAFYIGAGINLYLVYTYAIYCFDIQFNSLFIIYCAILGFAFYSSVILWNHIFKEPVISKNHGFYPFRLTGVYLVIVSLLFYTLWLSDIIPAIINHDVPNALKETGLVTNPVHVLDLSIILPGLFIAGMLLIRRNSFAYRLTPVILTFMILMDVTIIFLTIVMFLHGVINVLNSAMIAIMGLQALFCVVLLRSSLKSVE